MFKLKRSGFGRFILLLVTGVMMILLVTTQVFAAKVNLRFPYPVEFAGPLAKNIDGLCGEFSSQNPEIKVTPI